MSGAIACAFYRLAPHQGKNLIDVVLAASLDGGRTFTLKTTVTEEAWDPAVGAPWSHGDKNVTFIGDYFGLDASSSCFAPLWTDTRTGMQELFFSCLTIEKAYDIIGGEIGGEVIGGVKEDGGGWLLLPGGHPIPIGPWDPLIDVLPALGAYSLAHTIRDSTLRAKLQVAAIETVGEIAHQLSQKR